MKDETLEYAKPVVPLVGRLLAKLWRFRRALVAFGIFLLLYTGSYIGLSLYGIYEPAAIGVGGVKVYEWAPAGFVQDYKWNRAMFYFYAPLHELDCRFWHYGGGAPTDPRHVPSDIWEVYRAWE